MTLTQYTKEKIHELARECVEKGAKEAPFESFGVLVRVGTEAESQRVASGAVLLEADIVSGEARFSLFDR